MDILLAQIDMMIVEVIGDLTMSFITSSYYLRLQVINKNRDSLLWDIV